MPDYPEEHVENPPRWRNFQAYGARLVRDDLFDASYLVWHILHDLQWTRSKESANIICDWLDLTGDKLFVVRGKRFTPAEWDSWTKILKEVSDSPKIDEKTRSRVASAVKSVESKRSST